MKMKWLIIPLALLLFITIGCEDKNDDDVNILISAHSGDIQISAQLCSFDDNEFVDTYDLKFEYENQNYLVKLNPSAQVVAVKADTTFDEAELPPYGYSTDTSSTLVIGDSWMDTNPADQSIQGNGQVYFVRATNYEWIKLEILSGSPTAFSFKYATETTTPQTVNLTYADGDPAYFNFASAGEIEPEDWELGFVTLPVYAGPTMGTVYMPSVIYNIDKGVEVTVITDKLFEDVTSIPTGATWITDSQELGYEGSAEVLVYHPEPPYNHQVIVENDNYIYIFKTETGDYKVQFNEYDDVVIFDFAEL
ncbi:MAG: hypothetical protein H8E14_03635 [Candidatus Marinimicrobia bacterium]|nr:hypothetical protein [Candidatus Neomarinimicrobiota bacterium]